MNVPAPDPLNTMRDDWNRRAEEDAYYYVAFVNPNQAEDRFQRSAAEVILELESELPRLDCLGPQTARRRALEIGCGPGRLVLPMSRHFDEIYGVDIADEMIRIARERLRHVPNARFLVNNGCDLSAFQDDYFSFVYSYVVFQHIPSKEIVFNYLREIRRVLLPGGVTRFQLRGAAPSNANREDPATWKGCVLLDSEIVDFARHAGMELVFLSGAGTQYLWVTLRKPRALSPGVPSRPLLAGVTSTSTGDAKVPQRGHRAAISLWIRSAPPGTDLTRLRARIHGQIVRGAYLSPVGPDGECQMNVVLPRNLPLGTVEVALVHDDEVMSPAREIAVEPAALVPRVAAIYDAGNAAMEKRSVSGGLKVLMQEVEDPDQVRFQLSRQCVADVDVTSTNRFLDQFLFSFLLPRDLEDGRHRLTVSCAGRVIQEDEVEITRPMATLDAVTSTSGNPASVPQRGPGAAISLWIRNAPGNADLTTLSARINGVSVRGTYLSPIGNLGACQMDVVLPRNLPPGSAEVSLVQRGRVVEPSRRITIQPVVLVPRVIAARETRGGSPEPQPGSRQVDVLMDEVEDPSAIEFRFAGRRVPDVGAAPTHQALDQYRFTFPLPENMDPNARILEVYCSGRLITQAQVERKPAAATLEAVTASSSGASSVPRRGPQAVISLWIRHAPADADLNVLTARINGEPVRGCYLSPIDPEGGCQMNVKLPRHVPAGTAEVTLVQSGRVIPPARTIRVEPA